MFFSFLIHSRDCQRILLKKLHFQVMINSPHLQMTWEISSMYNMKILFELFFSQFQPQRCYALCGALACREIGCGFNFRSTGPIVPMVCRLNLPKLVWRLQHLQAPKVSQKQLSRGCGKRFSKTQNLIYIYIHSYVPAKNLKIIFHTSALPVSGFDMHRADASLVLKCDHTGGGTCDSSGR